MLLMSQCTLWCTVSDSVTNLKMGKLMLWKYVNLLLHLCSIEGKNDVHSCCIKAQTKIDKDIDRIAVESTLQCWFNIRHLLVHVELA